MAYRKCGLTATTLVSLLVIGISLGALSPVSVQAQGGPNIDIWYGHNQDFGDLGTPQRYVNILGEVSDPDGVASLVYSLNGGADSALSLGPDSRRLEHTGDFNVDIHISDLVSGTNEVVITATDNNTNVSVDTVNIDFSPGNEWPLPYSIDWGSASGINDVSYVVDGLWQISSGRIRTDEPGYDRLVAIGDTTWTDYEVTVPVIIHDYNSSGDVGILMRWNGHTDTPVSGVQPKSGWFPLGCIMRCKDDGMDIYGNDGSIIATSTKVLDEDVTYILKARVQTLSDDRPRYRFKAWEEGEPEPASWDMSATEQATDPQHGSLMLFAHEGDASFGDVNVVSLIISDIVATAGENSATISWTTDTTASSRVDYGQTTAYADGFVSSGALVTDHSITLPSLSSNTQYHYRVTSVAGNGDSASSADSTFTTTEPDVSGVVSDDFSSSTLNTSLWTYINPLGDAPLEIIGTNTEDAWAKISVPYGTEHTIRTSGNTIPRLIQSCNNTDFEIEVKFESNMTEQYQLQGIIVQQNSDNLIRFDFRSNGTDHKIYVASYIDLVSTSYINEEIDDGVPLYARVKRQGDDWTLTYSHNGQNWSTLVSFNHVMTVTAVGPFVGNSSHNWSPAHIGYIDYFFNTASPIVPEDGVTPTITSTPVTDGMIDVPYVYNVDAIGFPAAVYALTTSPAGMTISASTGEINWMPPSSGDFDVTVEAGNVVGNDDQDFTITVVAVPPIINSEAITRATVGHPYTYDVEALGGPAPTWSLTAYPTGMTIDPVSGLIEWMPAAIDTIDVTVVATNTEGADSQSYVLDVVDPAPPDLLIWYGYEQDFGQEGNPQPFVDIVGNVHDIDGVASLTYSLNGGPEIPLSMGPDGRRLESEGDFNAEIELDDLFSGPNEVVITATDGLGLGTSDTVEVNYTFGNTWPLPYHLDWSAVTNIHDAATPIDGLWDLNVGSLRTSIPGYDRVVGIGDTTWTDYEVTVPITMHDITSASGIGLLMRWNGHTDDPVSGWQPKSGWLPLGAICRYKDGNLEIYGNGTGVIASASMSLETETTYMFKVRVSTVSGVGGLYQFKVWNAGQPEPVAWNVSGQESLTDPQNGSLLLFAHRGDATFGDVSVVSLFIDNVQATVTDSSATVTWTTNRAASSSIAYGQTDTYEYGSVSDGSLVTSHSITLTGLAANTFYHFQVTSVDGSGSAANTGDLNFKTSGPSGVVSDDFNAPTLDSSLWTFVDPLGDATLEITGAYTQDAWASLSVPYGSPHSAWTGLNTLPCLLQPANDANMEVEVKFESAVTDRYQLQGIVVQQDSDNLVRFDVYSDGSETKLFAASLVDLEPTTHISTSVADGLPWYLRVKRESNQWTLLSSNDGSIWDTAGSFNHALVVTNIGPYVGNSSGGSSPSHTAVIDYFFNTESPIVPEDGQVPEITTTPDTNVTVGDLYAYDADAVGNPVPTFALVTFPTGMTINTTTGAIEWTPDTTGLFEVVVEAVNNKGADSQSYAIGVIQAPVIISAAVTDAIVDQPYTYDVNATGRPVPVYRLTTSPDGMAIDSVTGVISWLPEAAENAAVIVEAANSEGTDTQSFTVNVIGISPSITSTPLTDAIVGQQYIYDVEATGAPVPTYALTTLPGGMTIDSATGEIQWTPASAGEFDVTVEANNSVGTASQLYTIDVTEIPAITSTPDSGGIVGQPYTYDVDATGVPNPVYVLIISPEGMSIDSLSGTIAWTPTAVGDFDIMIEANNSAGADSQGYSVNVTEIPAITSTPATDATVGLDYSYDVDATGVPVPIFELLVAPAGMTIDSTSGEIAWVPTDAGDFDVSVQAGNSAGADTQAFSIHVVEAPAITSLPVIGGTVGQPYAYDVEATGSPAPTYALLTAPPEMTIDAGTGEIAWMPGANGDYDVAVEAMNLVANDTQSYSIHISEIPTIGSIAVDQGIIGQPYLYDVNATGDPIPEYALTVFPAGMTINSVSGEITWNPTVVGDYDVTVQATNTAGVDSQVYSIDVGSVPEITSTPLIDATVEQTYVYDIEATGDPVPMYGLITGPTGMTIDSLTGEINWTPTAVGDHDVLAEANNWAGSDSQSYSIHVVGVPPTVTSTPISSGTAGQLYIYDVDATGPPDPIYELVTHPPGMTIDSSTGQIEWLPTAHGDYDVVIDITNSAGTESHSFTIHIYEIPSVTSTAVTKGIVGQQYTYDVEASGDPVPTYTLTTLPDGMSIDSTAGLIQWIPSVIGYFNVVVRTENSVGVDSQSFAIHVNQIPAIVSTPVMQGYVDQLYTYDVNGSGDPAPTYALTTSPGGMTIDSATGIMTWTPSAVGQSDVVVEARNSVGVDSQSFTIQVDQIPVITSTPDTQAYIDEAYAYDVNSTGDPVPAYTLTVFPDGMTIDSVTGMIAWIPGSTGQFSVSVESHNSAGADTQNFNVMVSDTVRPTVAIVSPPSGTSFESLPALVIHFEDNTGLDRAYYQVDGCDGAWSELWSYNSNVADTVIEWTVPAVPLGNHAIRFMIGDDAANFNADSCSSTWTFTLEQSCCVGMTGNIDGDPDDNVDIGDLTMLIDYLFITHPTIECMAEANVDGSIDGIIDIGDISRLIDYLFIDITLPAPCE